MYNLDTFKITVETEEGNFGKFLISPLPRGYGYTLGNPLRRILLSSLEGGAVTGIKVEGVDHEYSSLAGVSDDILRIILNIKSLAIRCYSDDPVKATIEVKNTENGVKEVTANDIKVDSSVEIINKDQVITTLSGKVDFKAELVIEKGYGFRVASDGNRSEIGMLPVDGAFSPVENVEMKITNTRVGQRTDLDQIELSITTNGVLSPEDALAEAVKIFHKVGVRFVEQATEGFEDMPVPNVNTSSNEEDDEDSEDNYESVDINDLDLSTRLRNSLLNSAITDLRLLEGKTMDDLLEIKGMGKKSADELLEILEEYNINIKK